MAVSRLGSQEPAGMPPTAYSPDTGASSAPLAVTSADESLTGGGERYVPEVHHGAMLEPEHFSRYAWAAPLASGRDVLDAGCGVGWGTVVLANAGSRRVVGLDIDEPALANARERAAVNARDHKAAETDFVRGDLRRLPFDDESFDLIICFEAIEHVEEPLLVLNELRRVLRHGGILAVSSPNRGVYPAGNPFHLHELTAAELTEALHARFLHVAMYRQQTYVGSLLTDAAGHAGGDVGRGFDARLFKLSAGAPGDELYTVGLAGDRKLPELLSVAALGEPIDQQRFQPPSEALEHDLQHALERLHDSERARAAAEQARAHAEQWLEAHRTSVSWRLTAPLRALKRLAVRILRDRERHS